MHKKKRLDYLLIPNSSGRIKIDRMKRASKELKKRIVKEVLILNGKDSEEDILYLGKIVKRGDRIGFDTFPLHYKEYKEIIKRVIKQGDFPRGVKIENIRTKQDFREEVYGLLGLEEEKIRFGKVKYMKNRHEKFLQMIKNFVKKLFN